MSNYFPKNQLSVIVPVKNEQENVRSLIFEITGALEGQLTYEIIYINDGSTDDTLKTLLELKKEVEVLRVFTHKTSCGQSRAISTGVNNAQYEWIATLDGDGQNDPKDIVRMIGFLKENNRPNLELLAGWRSNRKDNLIRKLSSKIANTVRSQFLKDNTQDTGCGLKLFRKDAFLKLPYFDHMHRFLPALFQRQGGTVISFPVSHRPRVHGRSKYGINNRLWVGLIDLLGVAWLQRRCKQVNVVQEK